MAPPDSPPAAIELPTGKVTWRVREFVHLTGISKTKTLALIASGKLKALKIDGCVLITRRAIEDLFLEAK